MFEAALSLLEGAAFAIRGHAKDREKALRDCQQIAAACLVLRAAAKVDKEDAIKQLNGIFVMDAIHAWGHREPIPSVVATMELLSALPDAPKEASRE